jgi:hypothetical protein
MHARGIKPRGGEQGMAASEDREKIIRTAWEERGKAQWNPDIHGRGLISLHISSKVETTPHRLAETLAPNDDLEFRLVRATMSGQSMDSILCEGIVVETIGLTPPSTGWMNNSTDAANAVVHLTKANQRRNMAAISSQPDFVPPPPPQGLGLEGVTQISVQGRATLTVNFADSEAVTGWLSGQSEDVAVVFAARAALRVLPTITFGSFAGSVRRNTRVLVLRTFRAVAAAWSVAAYPGARKQLNETARAALFGLGDIKLQPPIRASVYASAAATGDSGAVSRAATAIGYALDAAGSRGRDAFQFLLEALALDASLLSDGFSAVTLATSRLWPGNIPDSLGDGWSDLGRELLDADENWEIWTDWYERRLSGDTPNQEIEIARVTIDHELWEQDPRAVNAKLRELLEEREIFQSAMEQEPEALPDPAVIPRQTETASRFFVDAAGRLDLLPEPPQGDDAQREFYLEVRHKALALSTLGHNQLAEMSEPVVRFLVVTPERYEDVSIVRLWSRGNTLRRRLKAHDTATAAIDPTDPAILSTLVAEMLRDLVESYNVFIVGDPAGRELDQVRLGPQDRRQAEAIVQLASPIAVAAQSPEGLATTAAIEALTEQLEAARLAPPGLDGDQAIDLSRKTAGNFIAELLRSAYIRVRGEVGFAWKETRAGTYRYAGPALIAGGYVSPIIAFVADQASNLRLFVEQAFHNPTLVQIIDVISKFSLTQ